MAYLDSSNVEDLVADIKVLTDAAYLPINTTIPVGSTSNPLSDTITPTPGSSSDFSKADHRHPFSYWTYEEDTGSFLDWCANTFTSNGSYYVVFASSNTSGWPENGTGIANVVKRNNNMYIFATTESLLSYKIKRHSNGTWESAWHETPECYYSYHETSGSFLDWCSTKFATDGYGFHNGCYYVVFETTNYTGWPESAVLGTALVQKRNNDLYVIAVLANSKMYMNIKNGTSAWDGWVNIYPSVVYNAPTKFNGTINTNFCSSGNVYGYRIGNIIWISGWLQLKTGVTIDSNSQLVTNIPAPADNVNLLYYDQNSNDVNALYIPIRQSYITKNEENLASRLGHMLNLSGSYLALP